MASGGAVRVIVDAESGMEAAPAAPSSYGTATGCIPVFGVWVGLVAIVGIPLGLVWARSQGSGGSGMVFGWVAWVVVSLWALYKAYRLPKKYTLGASGLLVHNWLRCCGGQISYVRIYYDEIETVERRGGGMCFADGCSCTDRAHYADVSAPMVVLTGVPMKSIWGQTSRRNVYLSPLTPDDFVDELLERKREFEEGGIARSPRFGRRTIARNAIVPATAVAVAQPVDSSDPRPVVARPVHVHGGASGGGGGRSTPPPPYTEPGPAGGPAFKGSAAPARTAGGSGRRPGPGHGGQQSPPRSPARPPPPNPTPARPRPPTQDPLRADESQINSLLADSSSSSSSDGAVLPPL